MSNQTTEEMIYLVECFFSREKVYSNAYRGFRTKYGTHKVKSENTLKRIIDNFALLETQFFPHAKKRGLVRGFHFMQDGATPHRTQEVFETIHKVYGNRIIGGRLEWPPYSPDLNPCDFFLWGYIKDHCYAGNPETVSDLVVAIKKVVSNIKDDMLEKVFTSFRKRIDFCTNSDGAHFENIYH
ncbi:hypothetical protein X777_05363 [Ooceraea biroi]|uniref:Uncharacterized protein n=1 Tax=Ooceraea biroi TaxID=2015173 RepID=A0A026WHF2_OOCBI|nr:hypothetical protein X777_05363 [Ooceraea biroi]